MSIFLIDSIKPKNNGAFPMVDDVDIKGGYRCLPAVADRDLIFSADRKPNMLVYTQAEDKLWKWGTPWIDNTSWVEIPLGAGGGGGGADEGLTARQALLDLATASLLIRDFQAEATGSEYKSVARLRTWVPEAETVTTSSFTMPNVGSNVSIILVDAQAYSVLTTPAQTMFVVGAGYFRVDGVSGTTITAHNLGTLGNASPTTVIGGGAAVSLPYGNFGDAVVYGRANGAGVGFDEFSTLSIFSCSAGTSGLTVIATRDQLISGGTAAGNTRLTARSATTGTIADVTGAAGTLAGGAAITSTGFTNISGILAAPERWVWFTSPTDGKVWTYGLDASPAITQADPGGLTKPHGIVVTDDGYVWICDRKNDTLANATLRQYLPLSNGALNTTSAPTIPHFLSQCQIVYTGRYIFGLDCTQTNAILHRFDPSTTDVDSYEMPGPGTADRSSLYFDGVGLWVSIKNVIYRINPASYGIQYSYTDPVSTIDYGVISLGASETSLFVAYLDTSNSHVGVRKFSARKMIDVDRLRVTSLTPSKGVLTDAHGELISGDPPVTLGGDVTGTTTANVVSFINGVESPVPGGGDNGKAIVYDLSGNRYLMAAVQPAAWKALTVSYGVILTMDVEGQNAPMMAVDGGSGVTLALHKAPYGRDTFAALAPVFRWPNKRKGMELLYASATVTDLCFSGTSLLVVDSSINDFPVTVHDPASGQKVARYPATSIGSSGWDRIYFVTDESLNSGSFPTRPQYIYLQKTGTTDMARINVEDGSFDLMTAPSSPNGPIYVHESATVAWMSAGTLVYFSDACDPGSIPTIQTSAFTSGDSSAFSSLAVMPGIFSLGLNQSGLQPRAWITQPTSGTIIAVDFPAGTNAITVPGLTSQKPIQITSDGTHLGIGFMDAGWPGDSSHTGAVARLDPVTMQYAALGNNTISDDGVLLSDGRLLLTCDSTKTQTDVTSGNLDAISFVPTDVPIATGSNFAAEGGGLRIAHPKRIAAPRNGFPGSVLYAICNAPVPGIYRYIDRLTVFANSLSLGGGFIDHVARISADYTVTSFDSTVAFFNLTANITLTLPGLPVLGQTFTFVDEDGSLGTWTATIDGNGNDVNGTPVYVMGGTVLLARQSITVKWTGGQWSLV